MVNDFMKSLIMTNSLYKFGHSFKKNILLAGKWN